MMDEIEKLGKAMETPPASTGREAAMRAALRAFDEEFSETRQETAQPARQTSRTQPFGMFLMKMLNAFSGRRAAFFGGASVAALSLVVFATWREAPHLMDAAPVGEPFVDVEVARPAGDRAREMAAGTAAQSPSVSSQAVKRSPDAMLDNGPAAAPVVEVAPAPQMDSEPPLFVPAGHDRFTAHDQNPVKLVAEDPVSTFSIDVDTASYAWMRRSLREGALPDPASVRTEELINYFPYDYAAPASAEGPFAVTATVMDAPWAEGRKLLQVGLRGYAPAERPRAHLTFLVDTSGSMEGPDRLPLLINSLRLLLDGLSPEDTVAIVTYAGSSTVALEPTKVEEKGAILDALEALTAGGGTAGAAGIETAYRLAERSFEEGAVNRVILATDGDFNIGTSSDEGIEKLIERKRESGVFLSVLGFGRDNFNDALMQTLAEAGNGQAAYIDTLGEARKALVDELQAMTPIAKDVKIQVEFNPALVSDYRLIGYESRALAREDFNNDKVDAGEVGAGHRVTAIYEFTPKDGPQRVDPPHFRSEAAATSDSADLAFLRLRWKAPEGGASQLKEFPLAGDEAAPDDDARFAAAVAGFGQILTGGKYLVDWSYDEALALASGAKGADAFGYRSEFIDLIRLARSIDR